MKEIVIYGRGGQGAVNASRLLAMAAFKEGKNVQSFPYFGVERRGAPVTAYTRLSKHPIRKRAPITEPDYVIVFDPALMESIDVARGLKAGGMIIVNSKGAPGDFGLGPSFRVRTFDASGIARKYGLGSETDPIVNTVLLGAFSQLSAEVGIDAVTESIKENMAVKTNQNMKAASEAYEKASRQQGNCCTNKI